MSAATLERPPKIDLGEARLPLANLETNLIYRAVASRGLAISQKADGSQIGAPMTAAIALAGEMGSEEANDAMGRLLSASLQRADAEVAMHARSLVRLLIRQAADLNITALEMGEAVPVRFLAGGAA